MNERGSKILAAGAKASLYGRGRICIRCQEQELSAYNPDDVCYACQEAMARPDADRIYDANGLPMSFSQLEVHVLLVLRACKGRPVRLYGTIHENGKRVSKGRITRVKGSLTRMGYKLRHHGALGTELVSEP